MLAVGRAWDSKERAITPAISLDSRHFLYDVQNSGSVPVSIR
jgi:hypothetical protein